MAEYTAIINRFNNARVLIIGDLMMDVYLKGNSSRLCPEAPVPVVDIEDRTAMPGGAANTACNLMAMGANVIFCSVVGDDADGRETIGLLAKQNIDTRYITRHPDRRTVTKSRILSGSQMITRIDHGTSGEIDRLTSRRMMRYLEKAYPQCDAVVISDYEKGVITPEILNKIAELRERDPKFLSVDSKRLPFFSALRPDHVKPNYDEAIRLLSLPRVTGDRVEQIISHAGLLYEKCSAALITATLDSQGTVVIDEGYPADLIPAPAVTAPHVSGAGDSYLSAFVLAYLHSADRRSSAEIATAAADIAIRKECTAWCSQTELRDYFNVRGKYVADVHELREVCERYRRAGKRIVFTNGCFDILHSGHVSYLHRARQLGDILIVGLNTDESIRRIKGENRPINALADRLQVLAGLSSVDHIIPFGSVKDDTPVPVIEAARPHVFAKGGDYHRADLPEAATVEKCGGEIILLDHIPDHSTTLIINRIQQVRRAREKTLSGPS